eukprot:48242-Prorocentrum_minimum.AAC.1
MGPVAAVAARTANAAAAANGGKVAGDENGQVSTPKEAEEGVRQYLPKHTMIGFRIRCSTNGTGTINRCV